MGSKTRDIFPATRPHDRVKTVYRPGGEENNGPVHSGSITARNLNFKSMVTTESGKAASVKQISKRLPEDLSKHLTSLSKDPFEPITSGNVSSPLSMNTSGTSEILDHSKTPSRTVTGSTGIAAGTDFQKSPYTPASGSSSSSSFQLPGSASSVNSSLPGGFQVRDNHFDPSPISNNVPSVSSAPSSALILTSGEGKSNSVKPGVQLQSINASVKSTGQLTSSSISEEETMGQKYSPFLDLTASPKIACTTEKKELQSREGFTSHTRPILSNLADAIGTGKVDQSATRQEVLKWDQDESRLFTAMKEALKRELGKEKNSFVDTCRLFLVAALASTFTMGLIVTVFWMSIFSEGQDQDFGPLPT